MALSVPAPAGHMGLAARGITVRFGGVHALSDVDLDLCPGEIRGVIGPNGAGKTTLFDVLSGIRRADRGSVWLGDADITRASATQRARVGIRRTFQRTQVFGRLSVMDNVLMAAEWRRGGGGALGDILALPARRRLESQRRERVRAVVERCGLGAVADVAAGQLPVGIARMVELARAVVDEPRVLMLDEPSSGLDQRESDRLREVMTTIRGEGCAVLLVEHDMSFVMEMCDRILVLDLGCALAEGTPEEIRDNPAVRSAYLG